MSWWARRNLRSDLTGQALILHHRDVDCLALGEQASLSILGVFDSGEPGIVLICGYWRGPDRVRELRLVRARASVLPSRGAGVTPPTPGRRNPTARAGSR